MTGSTNDVKSLAELIYISRMEKGIDGYKALLENRRETMRKVEEDITYHDLRIILLGGEKEQKSPSSVTLEDIMLRDLVMDEKAKLHACQKILESLKAETEEDLASGKRYFELEKKLAYMAAEVFFRGG